jgi:F-type H+-transporting ATPase subunit delta
MASSKAAERYAKSLYQLSAEKELVETVLKDIIFFKSTLTENRNLANVLLSPIIHGTKKQAILDAVFSKNLNDLTKTFFRLIVSKGREKELDQIASAFIQEDKKQKGIKDCSLVSASVLTADLRASLLVKAEQMANGKVAVTEKIDPSIIGGYILTVNDLQFDESVKTKLTKLRDQLIDTSYIPKIDLI